MVLMLTKTFRVVVLARFIHLKTQKLINTELKSPSLKNKAGNDYSVSAAKIKPKVWNRMLS